MRTPASGPLARGFAADEAEAEVVKISFTIWVRFVRYTNGAHRCAPQFLFQLAKRGSAGFDDRALRHHLDQIGAV
jgi:hypothetical protein